jgi:hypothetical protein
MSEKAQMPFPVIVDGRRDSGTPISPQQPGACDTPGVGGAAFVLAGAIIMGLERSIEMASLHAAEFGVGMMT